MKTQDLSEKLKAAAAVAVCAAALSFLAKKIALSAIPFLIPLILCLAARPLSQKLSRRFRVKGAYFPAVLALLILLGIGLGLFFLISAVLSQAKEAIKTLGAALEDENSALWRILSRFEGFVESSRLTTAPPLEKSLKDALIPAVSSAVQDLTAKAATLLASLAAKTVTWLPTIILSAVTSVISLFYLMCDGGGIKKEFALLFGPSLTEKIRQAKRNALSALSGYLKATLLMTFLTFAELLLGLVILKVEYALLLAFLIALFDALPVFGAGTVLVPWGLFSLAFSDTKCGVGLLLLFGVMYVVRQIAEPKIVGTVMGIHPLFSLAAVYVGFVFFGVSGMILFPIALFLIKAEMSDGGKTKNPPSERSDGG